ncbi:NYN domain-containing protein [Candidatus Lokiarchaeum ossiferum]|uniref:NYN domain-containing protein n=1 Tax=Candidatus Lokiarchaeum ossiferum TaxID=2951803 RepID=UPI00352E8914
MSDRMNVFLFLVNEKYERLSFIPLPQNHYIFVGREQIKQLCEDAYGTTNESYYSCITEVEMQDENHSLREHFIIERKILLDESVKYYIYDRNEHCLTFVNNHEVSAQGKRIKSGDIISIPILIQNSMVVQNLVFSIFSDNILLLDSSELERLEELSQPKYISESDKVGLKSSQNQVSSNNRKHHPQKGDFPSPIDGKKKRKTKRKLNAIKSTSDFKSMKYAKYESIVLDGSNIARTTTQSKKAKISDVLNVFDALVQSGVPENKIFVIFSASLRHNLIDCSPEKYEQVLRRKNFQQAPKRTDDDWFIIDFALRTKGLILTNDYFSNYRKKYPAKAQEIDNVSLRYTVLGDQVMFDEQADIKLHWLIKSNRSDIKRKNKAKK